MDPISRYKSSQCSTVWVIGVNWIQSSVSPLGAETSLVYWMERVPVAEKTMLIAGAWAESLSIGAGTTVGVGAAECPLACLFPPLASICYDGQFSTSFACTNAALTQPLPSGPAGKSICSHAPFASLPVRLTTSCGFSVPRELKLGAGSTADV